MTDIVDKLMRNANYLQSTSKERLEWAEFWTGPEGLFSLAADEIVMLRQLVKTLSKALDTKTIYTNDGYPPRSGL